MRKISLLFLCAFSVFALGAQEHDSPFRPVFRKNAGQWIPQVHYRCDMAQVSVSLLANGFSVAGGNTSVADSGNIAVWNLVFRHANPHPLIEAGDKKTSYSNYIAGNDPSAWISRVPDFGEIVYREVWEKIDVKFTLKDSRFEYDLILHPGADPADIRFGFEGVDSIEAEAERIFVHTPSGIWEEHIPLCYYESEGQRKRTGAHYFLRGPDEIGFRTDEELPPGALLVIDPVLRAYSTLVTGYSTSPMNNMTDIAVDAQGNLYGCGTYAPSFPVTAGSYSPGFNGGPVDAVVFKLSPDGSSLVYSTYFGGADEDHGTQICVNASGDVFFAGITYSSNLPVTAGVIQPVRPVNAGPAVFDVFAAHLDASGANLLWSSYLGGYEDEYVNDIVIDATGNIFLTGNTNSSDFPVTPGAFQPTYTGPPQNSQVYVCKIDPNCTALVYSTYIGGSRLDIGRGIAVDAGGDAYVTGDSNSSDFPVTPGAFQTALANGPSYTDAFVLRLNAQGSALVYATFAGGSLSDNGWGIAVNAAGEAFVTGCTPSVDFPVTAGAFSASHNDSQPVSGTPGDAFVIRLSPQGNTLLYSTFLGGAYGDMGWEIAINSRNQAWVAGLTGMGMTSSNHFPVTDCAFDDWPNLNFSNVYNGVNFEDIFFAKLTAGGDTLLWSSYYGGTGMDHPAGLALHESCAAETIWVGASTGPNYTNDIPFTTTPGAFMTAANNNLSASPGAFKFIFSPSFLLSWHSDTACSATIYFDNPSDNSNCPVLRDLAAQAGGWTWDFGDGTAWLAADAPAHTYPAPGNYTVTAYGNCDTVSQTVAVNECPEAPCTIFVPNAFSPNGDGQNDMLFVRSNCTGSLQFNIYNRWGELVFSGNDVSTGWDGKFRGKDCEPAVFTYTLEAQLSDGTVKKNSGNISLVK